MLAAAQDAAKCFRLRPCLKVEDFTEDSAPSHPALFVHHFFPDAHKWAIPADFHVDVYYTATTFDVYARVTGTNPLGVSDISFISVLETAQPFPAGFCKTETEFVEVLKALNHTEKSLVSSPPPKKAKVADDKHTSDASFKHLIPIPGKILGRVNYAPGDNRENYVWLVEAFLQVDEQGEFMKTYPFGQVHRRVEWFMHLYIDAMSSVEFDPRWRVLCAIRFFSPVSPFTLLQDEPQQYDPQTADLIELDKQLADAHGGQGSRNILQVTEEMTAQLRDPTEPFEILGLFTVYQFFSLPRDRARISQFFIFPVHQKAGLGRRVLTCLTEYFCSDSNIQQISVEDPAPGFQRLRDVVSIDRAISRGLIDPSVLHPSKTSFPFQDWPKYSSIFKRILLETPKQRHRLKILLKLAQVIPDKVLGATSLSAQVDARRHTRNRNSLSQSDNVQERSETGAEKDQPKASDNALLTWSSSNVNVVKIRIHEKRRLRLESLDWYSQCRSLNEVQAGLEDEWRVYFLSICGSIRTLRKLHPRNKT